MTLEPEKIVSTVCPSCGLGCGLRLVCRSGEIARIDYETEHPVNEGSLCSWGNICHLFVKGEGRLIHPLIRQGEQFRQVTWEEALRTVKEQVSRIKEKYGSDAIGIFASAEATNEENYLLQKLAKEVLGTTNIDNPTRLYHGSTLFSLTNLLGYPYMTNAFQHLERSDCILVVGADPMETYPPLARKILRAKEMGAKIIVVDPRRTKTSWRSDIHIKVKPKTDIFLFASFINCILTSKLEKQEYIQKRLEGFEKLEEICGRLSPEKVEKITEVPANEVKRAALTFALARNSSIIYSHGVTQYSFGTKTLQMIVYLALVTGNIGRIGTGLYPMMSSSNMQGACDMGCLPEFNLDYTSSEKKGLTLLEMVKAADEDIVKAIYVDGVDPLSIFPNPKKVREALSKLEFLVVQDSFMTETAKMADVVLPATFWAESEGTYTSMERRVQKVNMAVNPVGDAQEGWKIISKIAEYMGKGEDFNYKSWIDVFNEITKKIPQYSGLTIDKVTRVGGVLIPSEKDFLYDENFRTSDGKARVYEIRFEENMKPASDHDKNLFNLIVGGKRLPKLEALARKIKYFGSLLEEGYVEVSQKDIDSLGLSEGEIVRIRSDLDEVPLRVKAGKIKEGNLFTHYSLPNRNISDLFRIILDPESKSPEFKTVVVSVSKGVD